MAQLALNFAKTAVTRVATSLASSAISSLFADDRVIGPTLEQLYVLQSTEGSPMPIVFGRARIGGQVIWADKPKENRQQVQSGGKGGASTSERKYTLSFAVGLCEGVIDGIGRVWADGELLDTRLSNFRTHIGSEDQLADSLIQVVEGVSQTPNFKGLAYVVFEDFPLTDFGNRIPQLSFEVFRSPGEQVEENSLRQRLKGVTLIPASGEFSYATETVLADEGPGITRSENSNNSVGGADIIAALDNLERDLPACNTVSVVVSWFGDDLRCGNCQLRPGVETNAKITIGQQWQVNGVSRNDAHLVSYIDGRPAFGGTPSDASILQTIAELKSRGFRVIFYPFILMDVPSGNALNDPYGAAQQAVFPWRGRITCHPAPDQPASPDKSAAVLTQVDSFFGQAGIADFSTSVETISYTGAEEWSFRRMILHYANLCKLAGGVDGFLIGSELPGLTRLRSSQNQYPVVEKLRELAEDVDAILPATDISYAADWTEYFGHHPQDGSGDVYFHLDTLWADPAIDFVGIDWYVPLSDWRDGLGHLDAANYDTIYDPLYLQGNIEGGEGYDWYYASLADRDAQTRTNITDGASGKDWVFRYKDIKNWWQQSHFDRPGGVESTTATAWVPESKPIWFTETGCPAVDKGSNQPNVFYDPKSSESFLPYFSSGQRNDLIQHLYCEVMLDYWQTDSPNNPVSSVYGGLMVEPKNIQFWTWDARPFPDFPARTEVWSDGDNWQLGHWLNGRIGFSSLEAIIKDICQRANITDFSTISLEGIVTGYVIKGGVTLRQAIAPLGDCFGFDLSDRFGSLVFSMPGFTSVQTNWNADSFIRGNDNSTLQYLLEDAEQLSSGVQIRFANDENSYQPAEAQVQLEDAVVDRLITFSIPLVADAPAMKKLANEVLARSHNRASGLKLILPPSQIAYEVGDVVQFDPAFATGRWQIDRIEEQGFRELLLSSVTSQSVIAASGSNPGKNVGNSVLPPAFPALVVLDIPLLPGEPERLGPRVAAFAKSWAGDVQVKVGSDQRYRATLTRPAIIGTVSVSLPAGGFSGRFDMATKLVINMPEINLLSIQGSELLAGANSLAVKHQDGSWEVLQYQLADLQANGSWVLSKLLRGQSGTENTLLQAIDAGAQVVLLDGSTVPASINEYELGAELSWFGAYAGQFANASEHSGVVELYTDQSRLPRKPVHLKVRKMSGDYLISWVRRTRIGGDNWNSPDVPLAESQEQYSFSLFVNGEEVLSDMLNEPGKTITAAEMAGYFPESLPDMLDIAVAQISSEAGSGSINRQLLAI